jgi:hypothetical protein
VAGEGEVDVDEVGAGDADGGRRGLDALTVGADRDGAGLDVEQGDTSPEASAIA